MTETVGNLPFQLGDFIGPEWEWGLSGNCFPVFNHRRRKVADFRPGTSRGMWLEILDGETAGT